MAWFRSLCAVGTMVACMSDPSSHDRDSLAWVQQAVSIHSGLEDESSPKRQPDQDMLTSLRSSPKKQPEQDDMKEAGHLIESIIKSAVAKQPKKQKVKPSPPPKMTAEDRKREPATRKGVHELVLWGLRQVPQIPAVVRGSIAQWVTQEMMTNRKYLDPSARSLLDHMMVIDLSDVNVTTMHTKLGDFIQAFNASGFPTVTRTLSLVMPTVRIFKYLTEDTLNHFNLSTAAHLLNDLRDLVPLGYEDISRNMVDAATLLEANFGKHLTSTQLMEQEHVKGSKELPVLADTVFTIRDAIKNRENLGADAAQLLRDFNMTPVASFIEDLPTLNKTDSQQYMNRIAQMVDEFGLVDSKNMGKTFVQLDEATVNASTLLTALKNNWTSLSTNAQDSMSKMIEQGKSNMSEFVKQMKVKTQEYSKKAVYQFHENLIAYGKTLDVLNENVTRWSASTVHFVDKAVDNVTVAVNKAVDLGVASAKFFLCNLKGAAEVEPGCSTAPAVFEKLLEEAVVMFKQTVHPADKAKEELGAKAVDKILEARGAAEDESTSTA